MSEALDQPVVAEAPVAEAPAGVAAETPATTTQDDDIDTEAFDRVEVPDDDEAAAGDGQASDATDETPAAEPEDIEIEDEDGNKLKVPKALEKHLLRQQDYTKKTQEVAEQRRVLETKATELASQEAQQAESLKTLRDEHLAVANHETVLKGIDDQLAAYAKLTPAEWATLRTEKPDDYEAHRAQRQLLRDTRQDYEDALKAAKTDLSTKEVALTEKQAAARQTALREAWTDTNATLTSKIEGWSPARGQEIGTYMVKEFGVKPEELPEATDSRIWIMADRLMRAEAQVARLSKASTQAKATETALKTQTVTPAVKPAGGGAKPTGVSDKLSDDEWFRRRAAQKARKGR